MAGLSAGAWVAALCEMGNIVLRVDTEVAAEHDLVGLGHSCMANGRQDVVLLD